MGGRGSGSGMGAYRQNVRNSEDTIRNEPVEHLLLLGADGKIEMEAGDGQQSEVTVTPEMMAKARDAVMTHNHPRGSPFSWEDVHTAITLGVREIRATTAYNGTYSLRRNYELTAQNPSHYASFGLAYRMYIINDIRPTIQGRVNRGEINIWQANRQENDMRREWLRNNAKRFGYTYKEEK